MNHTVECTNCNAIIELSYFKKMNIPIETKRKDMREYKRYHCPNCHRYFEYWCETTRKHSENLHLLALKDKAITYDEFNKASDDLGFSIKFVEKPSIYESFCE